MTEGTYTIECTLNERMGKARHKIQDVSNLTGISRTTLTRLYYNKPDVKSVTYDVLAALCELYDCEPGDLLRRVKKK